MQSTAKSVTAYMREVPTERKAALKKLRDLCRAILTGFEETMDYGGPSYNRNGEVEVGFASQKHFIGLYVLRTDVMNTHRDRLKGRGVSIGKGAIRYSKANNELKKIYSSEGNLLTQSFPSRTSMSTV